MTPSTPSAAWECKRTDQSKEVEALLRPHFDQADAYRYNSASIRVRVIDERFEGMKRDDRYSQVETQLHKLPREIQSDIVTLLVFAPSDIVHDNRHYRELMLNTEFEEPSPSEL